MSGNTFGKLFTITTCGESHGVGYACIVDGCPPGMELSEEDLQHDLDRRKPGKSRHVTQRKETDLVRIISAQTGIQYNSRPCRAIHSENYLPLLPVAKVMVWVMRVL